MFSPVGLVTYPGDIKMYVSLGLGSQNGSKTYGTLTPEVQKEPQHRDSARN